MAKSATLITWESSAIAASPVPAAAPALTSGSNVASTVRKTSARMNNAARMPISSGGMPFWAPWPSIWNALPVSSTCRVGLFSLSVAVWMLSAAASRTCGLSNCSWARPIVPSALSRAAWEAFCPAVGWAWVPAAPQASEPHGEVIEAMPLDAGTHRAANTGWIVAARSASVPEVTRSTTVPSAPFALSSPALVSSLATVSASVCGSLKSFLYVAPPAACEATLTPMITASHTLTTIHL